LDKNLFISKIMKNERRKPIPNFKDELKLSQFLLPNIVDTSEDFWIMEKVTKWLTEK